MKEKLTIKDLEKILLDNFVNESGDLDISGLDFSDFDGEVDIGHMKVKGNLWQVGNQVKGNLYQDLQVVGENLHQDDHVVSGDLFQGYKCVGGKVFQGKEIENE